ncbi:adenine phosphoribosyltransferase [Candidatus Woesearchaeota archaeon]|nr:adenine phosphoribosyltransferase [Candidatus Woesearchaeota archaeon]
MTENEKEFDLKKSIRTTPHWPKQGVMFRDVSTLLRDPKAFKHSITKLKEYCKKKNPTKIVGIDSRGFIFASVLAHELNLPLVLIRKKGKLPPETVSQEYELEYGIDQIEMHKDSISAEDNVVIIDDLLATGGTMKAACRLVEKLSGTISGIAIIIDLPDLKGREKLQGYDIFHLVKFDGE